MFTKAPTRAKMAYSAFSGSMAVLMVDSVTNWRSSVQVGDLVRQKVNPQGVWLITRIDGTGNWFMAHNYGSHNTWLSIKDYEVVNEKKEKKTLDKTPLR